MAKRRFFPVWLAVLGLLCAFVPALARAEIRVVDGAGQAVALERPAQRLISLAPHITELLFAAGAGDRVVGAVAYSDYPEAAKAIPRVGGYELLDLEAVLALKPDLVVAWPSGNSGDTVARLRELGLTVYSSDPHTLEDIPAELERLGTLAGTGTAARQAAAVFRAKLAALRARYSDRPPVRVFYQIWDQPLMTVGGGHLISDVIRLCSGENVFAGLPEMAPQVSLEAVLAAAPEVIIASGMAAERPEWLDAWRVWPDVPAVRDGHLYVIHPDIIQRHTPRILQGAQRLCGFLERARVTPDR